MDHQGSPNHCVSCLFALLTCKLPLQLGTWLSPAIIFFLDCWFLVFQKWIRIVNGGLSKHISLTFPPKDCSFPQLLKSNRFPVYPSLSFHTFVIQLDGGFCGFFWSYSAFTWEPLDLPKWFFFQNMQTWKFILYAGNICGFWQRHSVMCIQLEYHTE